MQEVITIHEKFLKVYLPVAPDGMLTYGESQFALKYSNGKAMPSGFSHFYSHRLVLSTQKQFKRFFNISGRRGEVQPLKISSAARSFNLSGPPKIRTISGPCQLWFCSYHWVKWLLLVVQAHQNRWFCLDCAEGSSRPTNLHKFPIANLFLNDFVEENKNGKNHKWNTYSF